LVMKDDYSTTSTEKDSNFYERKYWDVNGRSSDGLKIKLGYILHFVVGTTQDEDDNTVLYNELL